MVDKNVQIVLADSYVCDVLPCSEHLLHTRIRKKSVDLCISPTSFLCIILKSRSTAYTNVIG